MSVKTYTGTVQDGQVVLNSHLKLPEGSEVYVVIPQSIDMKSARRSANKWLVGHVGNLLMAMNGSLVQSENSWYWRFEVYMTAVNSEPEGPIGIVDVDATTGSIIDEKLAKQDLLMSQTLPSPTLS